MCSKNVLCPVCSHPSFENIDSLRISLITAANGPASCPQCNEIFLGLDKFTIHLFSHSNLVANYHGGHKETQLSLLESSYTPATPLLVMNADQQHTDLIAPEIDVLPKCDLREFSFETDTPLDTHEKLEKLDRLLDLNKTYGEDEINNTKSHIINCWETNSTTKNVLSKVELYQLNLKNREVVEKMSSIDIARTPELDSGRKKNSYMPGQPRAYETSVNLIVSTKEAKVSEAAKLWGCDICTKSFTTKYFLKKHKRLHTGEMPYHCAICERTFTFQQSYHKHLLYHSDEKPHTCQTCHRAFKELSTLHNHERIHSGEKPFKCEICGKLILLSFPFCLYHR